LKRIAMSLGVIALTCGLIAASRAVHRIPQGPSDADQARAAVLQVEERWLANENNPAVLETILADNFIHVLPQGFISKEQHIAFVRDHPSPPLKTHRFEKLEVRVYGNVAIANGIVLAVPVNGAARRTYFTDVFVLRGGHWPAVNAQESEASDSRKP
jgi:hypothetical protein